MQKAIEVRVLGQSFRVRNDPAYLRRLETHVSNLVESLRQKAGGVGADTHRLAVLAALTMADELLQAQDNHRRLRRQIKERSENLLAWLEQHSGA